MSGVMAVMGAEGDTRVIWDRNAPPEVEAAKLQFNRLVGENRYAAFKATATGEKGEKITQFDPAAERIILVPPMQGG